MFNILMSQRPKLGDKLKESTKYYQRNIQWWIHADRHGGRHAWFLQGICEQTITDEYIGFQQR